MNIPEKSALKDNIKNGGYPYALGLAEAYLSSMIISSKCLNNSHIEELAVEAQNILDIIDETFKEIMDEAVKQFNEVLANTKSI